MRRREYLRLRLEYVDGRFAVHFALRRRYVTLGFARRFRDTPLFRRSGAFLFRRDTDLFAFLRAGFLAGLFFFFLFSILYSPLRLVKMLSISRGVSRFNDCSRLFALFRVKYVS